MDGPLAKLHYYNDGLISLITKKVQDSFKVFILLGVYNFEKVVSLQIKSQNVCSQPWTTS